MKVTYKDAVAKAAIDSVTGYPKHPEVATFYDQLREWSPDPWAQVHLLRIFHQAVRKAVRENREPTVDEASAAVKKARTVKVLDHLRRRPLPWAHAYMVTVAEAALEKLAS